MKSAAEPPIPPAMHAYFIIHYSVNKRFELLELSTLTSRYGGYLPPPSIIIEGITKEKGECLAC
jgi:hypothetical protein